MTFFNKWYTKKREDDGQTSLWFIEEAANNRDSLIAELIHVVRSHYDDLDRIAEDISDLGFKAAEKILKARLPRTKTARSGDLGEILATEFAEEEFNFKIPIRRLRYKDGRDMALRGDDFIGLRYTKADGLYLLKGESKSRLTLSKTTITQAREVLDRDHGRCTPISLAFVSDRLLESADKNDRALGKILRQELAIEALKPSRITHALITISGNSPVDLLRNDLKTADASRQQNVVNIYIPDHGDFIKLTFEEVAKLGKP